MGHVKLRYVAPGDNYTFTMADVDNVRLDRRVGVTPFYLALAFIITLFGTIWVSSKMSKKRNAAVVKQPPVTQPLATQPTVPSTSHTLSVEVEPPPTVNDVDSSHVEASSAGNAEQAGADEELENISSENSPQAEELTAESPAVQTKIEGGATP